MFWRKNKDKKSKNKGVVTSSVSEKEELLEQAAEEVSAVEVGIDAEYDTDREEIITTMGELQDGDLVQGVDGKWYPCKILDIQEKPMYRVVTSSGSVECSFDHDWILFEKKKNGDLDVFGKQYSTQEIFDDFEHFKGWKVGIAEGPELLHMESIGENQCRCIQTDAPSHQFAIKGFYDQNSVSEGGKIFSRNCQGRLLCGRASTAAASMMLFGTVLGLSVESRKGAGLISSAGVMSNIQYYYSDPKWIENWFADRGLDKNGKVPGEAYEQEINLNGEEEFSIRDNDEVYKFDDIQKEVLNKHEQKFENI